MGDVAPSEKIAIVKSSKSRTLIGGRFGGFDFLFNACLTDVIFKKVIRVRFLCRVHGVDGLAGSTHVCWPRLSTQACKAVRILCSSPLRYVLLDCCENARNPGEQRRYAYG